MYRLKPILAVICVMLASACSESDQDKIKKLDPIDRVGNLTVDDYKDYLLKNKEPEVKIEKKKPPIPDVDESLLKPAKPKIGVNKTVTLSVTDDVPIKDVFIELARLADIDIEVDPAIEGGVIFKVKDKPFGEVIERLTSIAKLRYSVNNGVLRIEPDLPFVVNYPVNFINLTRSGSGSIDVSTNVLGASEQDSGAVTTGASSSLSNSYDGDLWASIETSLTDIIGDEEGAKVNINRQASIISVRASEDTQKTIFNYLKQVREFYSSQVLIEAKVLEVQLSDQFRSGIDWSNIDVLSGAGIGSIQISTPQADPDFPATIGSFEFSQDNGGLESTVSLVQVFGTTRTLSSPRIMAINNQQSIFSFVRNEIYFLLTIESEEEENDDGTTDTVITTESELKSVPIGIVMSLQPSIDEKRNEVIMHVRPTLSRTTGRSVADPAVDIQVAQIIAGIAAEGETIPDGLSDVTSTVPEVEVRELDTVMRLKNGQIMVIGGMIEERVENVDSGVPYFSEIPLVGNAFKSVEKETTAVQTVIFLKATIIPGYGVDEIDQEFYNKFSTDPRPFNF